MSGHGQHPRDVAVRHRPWIASALVIVTVLATGVSLAPPAQADPTATLRDAIVSARGESSCGPLQDNAVVQQAAEVVNQSTDDYLDQTATQIPIEDALAGLKALGYGGTKAYLLRGAGRTDSVAIKGALLQGYSAISDCSYTDFGVSIRRNAMTRYNLASVVLAGP